MNAIGRTITQHRLFAPFIMGVILVASLAVGLETYPNLSNRFHPLFATLDTIIQIIFTVEITLRILALGNKPWRFFRSKWNTFDFAVTSLFYLPFGGAYASVLRLVRILRIFRVFSALPRLQLLVGALIKSIPSIGYVGLLLFIQFYIYAVIGNVEFGDSDPAHFGDLGRSLITLFEIVTLEGWVEIYSLQSYSLISTLYYVSFIVVGTMIILNLFIGVVISGFEEVREEMEEARHIQKSTLSKELELITNEVDDIKIRLKRLARSASKQKSSSR